MKNSAKRWYGVWPLLVLGPVCHAAPVDGVDDLSLSSSSFRSAERPVASMSQGNLRTVDLLIEMQNKRAWFSFDERSRSLERGSAGSATSADARTAALSLVNGPSGMFGSGVNTAAAGRELKMDSSDWKLLQTPSAGPSTTAATQLEQRRGSESGGRLPLFGEVLQFVRNHRVVVGIVAVGALILVWAASAVASQRRR